MADLMGQGASEDDAKEVFVPLSRTKGSRRRRLGHNVPCAIDPSNRHRLATVRPEQFGNGHGNGGRRIGAAPLEEENTKTAIGGTEAG